MVLGKGIATNSQFLKSQQACITMTVHVMMSSLRQLLIVIVVNYEQVISKGIYSIAWFCFHYGINGIKAERKAFYSGPLLLQSFNCSMKQV